MDTNAHLWNLHIYTIIRQSRLGCTVIRETKKKKLRFSTEIFTKGWYSFTVLCTIKKVQNTALFEWCCQYHFGDSFLAAATELASSFTLYFWSEKFWKRLCHGCVIGSETAVRYIVRPSRPAPDSDPVIMWSMLKLAGWSFEWWQQNTVDNSAYRKLLIWIPSMK